MAKGENRKIGLIVARSENNVIGKGGRIPWNIEGELSQFRELTMGNAVVMGSRTYEEIGRPLPGRMTIVVSGSKCFEGDNICTVRTLEEAISVAGERKVYVAGGGGLYKEALPIVDVMYITEIHTVVEDGDTFFPEFDVKDFEVTVGATGGDEIKYTRTVYRRKKESYDLVSDSPAKRIYDAVKRIPYGHVATYAQIAELAGNRKMARAVGNALHNNPEPDKIPCYRVVNAKGELADGFAFGGAGVQRRLLEAEGVEVVNGKVELDRYQWVEDSGRIKNKI